MRKIVVAAVGVSLGLALTPARADVEPVSRTSISFTVTLSQDATLPGSTYTVRGYRYSGEQQSPAVALLLHGLSYGYWAWDFRVESGESNPYRYSTARYLASHGIDAVAIDELGYGSSDKPSFPDSRQLTIPAYASIAHQIVTELRKSYSKVAIVGHSAGGEMSNFEAGRYRDVDALVDLGMCDVGASPEIIADAVVNDVQGIPNDYVYFGDNPAFGDKVAERTKLMYNTGEADPDVVAEDNSMANLTPSAEVQSISPQPAKAVDGLVNVPVLVGFGSKDAIFPPPCQQIQPLLYPSSPSVSTFTLVDAGHTLMLHRNAGLFEGYLADWLSHVLA